MGYHHLALGWEIRWKKTGLATVVTWASIDSETPGLHPGSSPFGPADITCYPGNKFDFLIYPLYNLVFTGYIAYCYKFWAVWEWKGSFWLGRWCLCASIPLLRVLGVEPASVACPALGLLVGLSPPDGKETLQKSVCMWLSGGLPDCRQVAWFRIHPCAAPVLLRCNQ